ncbi:hypothetical protein Vadar_024369 [Vaccinium darrowii]|uniref:Uncharacterized protein n=1 Tax=Vaccinium darrowii TaxID=229202 RepID=A0ACB7ZMB8_9ERIC|nr:hypothetical protein Vadar_024369 [Vaccinium darrowii]
MIDIEELHDDLLDDDHSKMGEEGQVTNGLSQSSWRGTFGSFGSGIRQGGKVLFGSLQNLTNSLHAPSSYAFPLNPIAMWSDIAEQVGDLIVVPGLARGGRRRQRLSRPLEKDSSHRRPVQVQIDALKKKKYKAEEAAISQLKRSLGALNTYLASNTYLVGHAVTLADIIMTCNLLPGFTRVMTKSFTAEFPHVERYFWTMINQPNFRKIFGEVKQAEKVFPVASKKPSEPKEAAKPKPKEELKKEAKKEQAKPKVDDGEEEEQPKPKPKNPLDLLPPSKMILDDWKRLYSNTKTNFREIAIKGFWDMYDPEGYSLWFCDYKYNDENTVSFVTLNKVGGFLQRMDLARKYAFGKMLVIGSEPPFKVKGLWLFRGQEIPQFVMDECYDMELYEWTKVDLSDEAQKERVNQMIEDQEPFEGEALLDAKCFK